MNNNIIIYMSIKKMPSSYIFWFSALRLVKQFFYKAKQMMVTRENIYDILYITMRNLVWTQKQNKKGNSYFLCNTKQKVCYNIKNNERTSKPTTAVVLFFVSFVSSRPFPNLFSIYLRQCIIVLTGCFLGNINQITGLLLLCLFLGRITRPVRFFLSARMPQRRRYNNPPKGTSLSNGNEPSCRLRIWS